MGSAEYRAIPTASTTAPPEVRRVALRPALRARGGSGPHAERREHLGRVLIRSSPRMGAQAAISAIKPTNPRAPSLRWRWKGCRARGSIIFGVVPEAMSEWNPEIAPHAILMKTKGKSGPETLGAAMDERRKRRHLKLRVHDDAHREQHHGADLHERREISRGQSSTPPAEPSDEAIGHEPMVSDAWGG